MEASEMSLRNTSYFVFVNRKLRYLISIKAIMRYPLATLCYLFGLLCYIVQTMEIFIIVVCTFRFLPCNSQFAIAYISFLATYLLKVGV